MKSKLAQFLAFISLTSSLGLATLQAQMPDVKAPVQAAMQELSIMVGDWEGTSWTMSPDGTRQNAAVRESIQWKLDETVLLIEGRGTDENDQKVHHALATLCFDPLTRNYKFDTHTFQGLNTQASFEVLEANAKFRWGYEIPGGQIRFTITFTENGHRWHEKGEFSPDGERWFPTMEMNLQKA
ncbi:hypothetical protein QEH56_04590 [Pelagicoccus enzymogenes]|uniref:hypothetical protein n=1 Tax=Pelagicoccus enzymogenes TaxID=2773457 RepID=UPI00280F1D17|nr:hypothetical protein [Pelagicoccus enzymogenes]MDQ8197411.1 hypothetical protein [Pelagicoccus enzymogenes]